MNTAFWKELEDTSAQTITGGKVVVDGNRVWIYQDNYSNDDLNGNGFLDATDAAITIARYTDYQVPGKYLKDASKSSLTLIESYKDTYSNFSYNVYAFKLAVGPKQGKRIKNLVENVHQTEED